jgi:hypothetical protein
VSNYPLPKTLLEELRLMELEFKKMETQLHDLRIILSNTGEAKTSEDKVNEIRNVSYSTYYKALDDFSVKYASLYASFVIIKAMCGVIGNNWGNLDPPKLTSK